MRCRYSLELPVSRLRNIASGISAFSGVRVRPASSTAVVAKAKTKAAKTKGGGGKKGLANSKDAASRGDSNAKDDDEVKDRKGDDESEEQPKKRRTKKVKHDPEVAQRLSKLEVEKDLLLCEQRWSTKIKLLNKEVTQSMTAAETFKETSGFLGMFILSACVWNEILFKPKAKTTQREFPSVFECVISRVQRLFSYAQVA